MARKRVRSALILVLLGCSIAAAHPVAAQNQDGIGIYRNERHGFTLSYPTDRFLALPVTTQDGRQFISKDGNARLLVGTLPNFDGKSLKAYRAFLLAESFPAQRLPTLPSARTGSSYPACATA